LRFDERGRFTFELGGPFESCGIALEIHVLYVILDELLITYVNSIGSPSLLEI